MTHRLYKIEITLSIQASSKEVHGYAARRVKTHGIPVKLKILPPDVRSENEPFRNFNFNAKNSRKLQRQKQFLLETSTDLCDP